jgi:NhaC family Na+:H+ antiporter
MAATLGVATFAYLPFAFFNLINPVVSVAYGFLGITITKLEPEEVEMSSQKPGLMRARLSGD